jgi:hypothetical protein
MPVPLPKKKMWVGHLERAGVLRNSQNIVIVKLEGKGHFGDLGVYEKGLLD